MRNRGRGARLALLLGVLAGGAVPAAAGDVVIMPFRCSMSGGKPVLTPASDQAHRIFGEREQRKVKTCSTVDPKRCRQWSTYRFDMDCGGARVSWMDVFANAGAHTRRRVWERDGRLRVADTPQRSKRVDDMCARRMGSNMEWWSVNEICDEASPLNAPTSTDMPAGFAPMVGLEASILAEDVLRSPSQRAALAQADEAKATRAGRDERSEQRFEDERGPRGTAERDAGDDEPARRQSDVSEMTEAADAAPPSRVPAAEATGSDASETQQGNAAPVVAAPQPLPPDATREPVTVINNAAEVPAPASQASEATSPAVAARHAIPAVRSGLPATQEVTSVAPAVTETVMTKPSDVNAGQGRAAPDTATEPIAQAGESAQTTGSIAGQGDDSAAAATAAPAAGDEPGRSVLSFAIAAFVAAALAMTALVLNWLYRSPSPVTHGADEAGVWSGVAAANAGMAHANAGGAHAGGARADRSLDLGSANRAMVPVARPARQMTVAAGSGPLARVGERMGLGSRMPATKPEALAVLGMGVAGDGNVASLKKIIDGLRMNWHPDLANDDADRETRELRLKQINAAWEILGGKGAEA